MDLDVDDEEFLKVLELLDNQKNETITTDEHVPRTEHIQCLLNCFGHNEFRPLQWKVIRSIIEDKRDNCCIMATGYGKSLCFQFPPVFANGISLIISPLISLMQDQVKALNLVNIKACMLGSVRTATESDVIRGDYRIVYASPEYISGSGSFLIEKLKDKLTLIAVDEAHCISSWGADFRPKYLDLKNIRNNAPDVPILAVTATATERVQQDICTILKLRNPQVICTGFDRPNLEIMVRRKSKEPWDDIGLILKSKLLAEASCIIYCLTKKITDSLCDELQRHGLKCGSYHAGKTQNQRKDVFDKFVRDEINIIVATVAFGMGIDKSDVRCVIHYGAPQDMDSYYQEIGRAGRDGVLSKCILFYSEADFETHRHLRMKSNLSDNEVRKAESRAQVMSDFIYTKQCRRIKILQYFDGPSANCPKHNICCDNCRTPSNSSNAQTNDNNKEVDFSKDAKVLLDAIRLFDGNSGLSKPIAVIRGSKLKTIERYHNNKLMGSGKYKSEQYWKVLADLLVGEEFLQRQSTKTDGFGFTTIKLSRRAQQWLDGGQPLKLVPPEQMIHLMESEKHIPMIATSSTKPLYDTSIAASSGTLSVKQPVNKSDEELKRNLMMVRAIIASREGTMPYKIASAPAIDHLVRVKPLNLQELRNAKIEGFSEALIKQFGPEFLICIQRSIGLLPQNSSENMGEMPQGSDISDGKEDQILVDTSYVAVPSTSSKISTDKKDNIPPSLDLNNTSSDYQNVFDDDDDLFMMVDYENSKENLDAQKPVQSKDETKKPPNITTTVTKRVKYENSSSSDEDKSSPKNKKSDESARPTFQNPPKPIGIRKRNIF